MMSTPIDNPFNLSASEMPYLDDALANYTLPWPPSINNYYATYKGRRVLSKKGRAYKKIVGQLVVLTRGGKLAGRLVVDLILSPPDKRKRDIDNVSKSVLDALMHAGVYDDDSQIDRLTIQRSEQVFNGKVDVRISKQD